jgi:predicted acylesterase/phospholipase RssA
MGLTLIRKSDGRRRKKNPKIALVLAGGAVTGGAFKVGGIAALEDYLVGRGLCDLDVYVGLSAGALLAVPLAGGIRPDEMMRVLEGTSEKLDQLRPIDFYSPNLREFAQRPARFALDVLSYLPGIGREFLHGLPGLPDAAGNQFRRFVRRTSYSNFESLVKRVIEHTAPTRSLPAATDYIPTGLFDNAALEGWLRRSLDRLSMPNDFGAFQRKRGVELYLSACDLDTSERVIFGGDEVDELTIAQAVQASTALPLFYKPARLNGVDYVDGGVRHTANIDVAIEKGADLVICYNPFRPFVNHVDSASADSTNGSRGNYLSARGAKLVANQVFRTLLHSRLELGIQRYLSDDSFRGDIVLLEPHEQDASFFAMNPLAFWRRSEAMQRGFESVHEAVGGQFEELAEVMGRYGLELSREAAGRRAGQTREEHGWVPPEPVQAESSDSQNLRLVGD